MAKDGLLWPCFQWLNAKQVPVFGTIVTGVFASLIGFLLDLADLANMISIGTLMAFTVVCAGVIILRYKSIPGEPEVVRLYLRPRHIPLVVVAYIIFSVLFATIYKINVMPVWASALFGIPVILIYIWLQFQKVTDIPKSFKCPLVPLFPCLGMLVNIFVILSLPVDAIYRVLIWSFIGLLIYFLYGIRHSKLNDLNPEDFKYKLEEEDESESTRFPQSQDSTASFGSTPARLEEVKEIDIDPGSAGLSAVYYASTNTATPQY